VAPDAITALGDVLIGVAPGRQRADDITLFDGTGVALQDLAVAAVALRRAIERGLATEVEI
jgi:ornithine cyclodeaminase